MIVLQESKQSCFHLHDSSGTRPAEFFHIHYRIGFCDLSVLFPAWKDAEERLFDDTFYDVRGAAKSDDRTLWLRKRIEVVGRNEHNWVMTETWKEEKEHVLCIIQSDDQENIQAHLRSAGHAGVISDIESFAGRLDKLSHFRFFRREMRDQEFGIANVDRTLFGIFVTFRVNKAQRKYVQNVFMKSVEPCNSKVMSELEYSRQEKQIIEWSLLPDEVDALLDCNDGDVIELEPPKTHSQAQLHFIVGASAGPARVLDPATKKCF